MYYSYRSDMHFVYLCRTHFVLLVENFTENSYRGIITDLVRLKRITRAILLPFLKGFANDWIMVPLWYDEMKQPKEYDAKSLCFRFVWNSDVSNVVYD